MSGGAHEDWLSQSELKQLAAQGWSLSNDAAARPDEIPTAQVFPVDEDLDHLLVNVKEYR